MNPQHVRRSFERWHWGIFAASSFLLCLTASSAQAIDYANSFDQWSTTGSQGENNWFYGYYNFSTDTNGLYEGTEFIPFTNSAGPAGGPVSPDGNHWRGPELFWDLTSAGSG